MSFLQEKDFNVTSLTPTPIDMRAAHGLDTGGPVQPRISRLHPLGPSDIEFTGGLWKDLQELNATSIIFHCHEWMERIGWVSNFDRVANNTIADNHAGIEFVDSEVYKLLEAMAWELGRNDSPEIAELYAQTVHRVGAAQQGDGYLNTSFGQPGQRGRYTDLEWGHELYCFGHLIQAAVARIRTGHSDALPAIARRAADHLYREFGPHGRVAVGGHPEIEPALVELGRATGDLRYFELARLFVERRGTGTLGAIEYGQEYFQDDVPIRDAKTLRGHAVRALYLSAGAYDVAVDSEDHDLASALREQWRATVSRRTYITGGMGSHHRDESFGTDYELPPDRAYSETCAGIASVMLSWRMLLDTGESKYSDLIERTLLNNVLASPRADGKAFFYTNTLHQRVEASGGDPQDLSKRAESQLRAPWFEVSCCPTNVARTLASAPMYFATTSDNAVQIHQYGAYRVSTTVAGRHASISVASDYPWDGRITVTVETELGGNVGVHLRLPAWARDRATWECTNPAATLGRDGDYLKVGGDLRAGDQVTLLLPLDARITYPHPAIDAIRGQVAVERGPLVLALESLDLPPGVTIDDVAIDTAADLVTTPRGASVGLVVSSPLAATDWPYVGESDQCEERTQRADLIPYFQWANRGPSTMRVFVPAAPVASRGGDHF